MHSFNLSVRLAFYFTMNMSWTCHCPWLILLETFCYHTIGVPTMKQEPFLTNVKQFWFAVGACITARIIWNNWYVQDRRKQRYIFSYGNVSVTEFFLTSLFTYSYVSRHNVVIRAVPHRHICISSLLAWCLMSINLLRRKVISKNFLFF